MREIRHRNGDAPIHARKPSAKPIGLLVASAALIVIVGWAAWKALM